MKIRRLENSTIKIINELLAEGKASIITPERACRIDHRIADVFEKANKTAARNQCAAWGQMINKIWG